MINPNDIQIAIQHFQSGNLEAAKGLLNPYIQACPDDINANMLAAAINASENNFSAVLMHCEKVLQADPMNLQANYNAAVAAEKLADHQRILKYTDNILLANPGHLHAVLLQIAALYDTGQVDSAGQKAAYLIQTQNSAEALQQLRLIYSSRQAHDALIAVFQQVLAQSAGHIQVLGGLVQVLLETGDFGQAASYLKTLQNSAPQHPDTLKATIHFQFSTGHYADCLQSLETHAQTINLQADPALILLLAQCYQNMQHDDKAIALFQQLIKAQHRVAFCWHSIGMIESRRFNPAAAIEAYTRALDIEPTASASRYNLAFLYDRSGNKKAALQAVHQSYLHNPSVKIREGYIQLLSSVPVEMIEKENIDFIQSILADDEVDAQTLSQTVSQLLKRNFPIIAQLLEDAIDSHNAARFEGFYATFQAHIEEITAIPLLLQYYTELPVVSFEFEQFSTLLRRAILKYVLENKDLTRLSSLAAALAIRCYINGYLFAKDETETDMLQSVIESIRSQPDGLPLLRIYLAMYVSLYEQDRNLQLPAVSFADEKGLDKLVALQLTDNLAEEAILQTMEAASISDATSLRVQKQYEGNPYPVWQKLTRHQPTPVTQILQGIAPTTFNFSLDENSIDMLIAGSGTGSHVLQTAMRIQHQSLTAIDLSRKSLAFAIRKAKEYGQQHIRFRQMDILNVATLGQHFDIVESIGVLHHMQDPLAGMKALVSVLKPGGLMNLGFYSKIGRRYIIQAKQQFDRPEAFFTDDEIRQRRFEIIEKGDKEMLENLLGYKDFYTLHDCRDLIFHENEHNYDLHELQTMIQNAGLKFVGFELYDKAELQRFKAAFPQQNAEFDLANWAEYEKANPDVFSSMYVFWCQKPYTEQ